MHSTNRERMAGKRPTRDGYGLKTNELMEFRKALDKLHEQVCIPGSTYKRKLKARTGGRKWQR